jgi:hypothetical protein
MAFVARRTLVGSMDGRPGWRRIRLSSLLLLGPCLWVPFSGARAQDVSGRVASDVDLRPIAGAEVLLDGTRFRTLSDSLGRFTLRGVPNGAYLLLARHPSYLTVQDTIVVTGSGREDVVVFLAPDPIAMDTIHVRVISEAERRWRASGSSHYVVLDHADLMTHRERGVVNVGDLFWSDYRMSPWIRHDKSGSGVFLTDLCLEYPRRVAPPIDTRNTMFGSACRLPAVLLDGDLLPDLGFVQRLSIEDIQTVELVPPLDASLRYGMAAQNGALVITTRMAAAETVASQVPLTPLQQRHRAYLMAGTVGGILGGVAYGVASGLFQSQGVSFTSDFLPALGIVVAGLGVGELAFRKFGIGRN